MKKVLLFYVLTLLNVSLFAQDKASLTKDETINYINKKLQETFEIEFNSDFDVIYKNYPERLSYKVKKMYILSNSIKLNSNGTITHTDKIASSLSSCYQESYYYGSKKCEVSFNPIHIIKVDTVSNNDPRIGLLKITFLANTEKWEKHKYEYKMHTEKKKKVFSHHDFFGNAVYYDDVTTSYSCDNSWSSTDVPKGNLIIYFFKSDPENGKKLIKAFSHLIDLGKAEDDPFGE